MYITLISFSLEILTILLSVEFNSISLILKFFKWFRLTSNFGSGIFVQSTLKKSFWFIIQIYLITIFYIKFFDINCIINRSNSGLQNIFVKIILEIDIHQLIS